jgi:hypothetical protein
MGGLEDGFATIDAWMGRDSGFNQRMREALTPDEFSLLEREAVRHKRPDERGHPRDGAVASRVSGDSRDPKDARRAATGCAERVHFDAIRPEFWVT